MEPIIKLQSVCKSFPAGKEALPAVKDVSFSLMPGKILAIVGPSGSGKSTVARLIARLIDPDAGQIFLQGQDITRLTGRKLLPVYRKVQMVFQSPAASFDPRKTLGYSIAESLINQGVGKTAAGQKGADLLVQCGLDPSFAQRYPHQVSGGECQRAAIARALAVDPEVLILDEATSSLDVTVQAQILQLLAQIHRQRSLSYLFICHNLALVQQFCHRVLVMDQGQIVEAGTAEDVICRPVCPVTKALVEAAF